MGRNYGPEFEFTCFNDCKQTGCPGHKIRAVSCRSSDVYSFEIDGKGVYLFDENTFAAILKAHEAFKAQYQTTPAAAQPEPQGAERSGSVWVVEFLEDGEWVENSAHIYRYEAEQQFVKSQTCDPDLKFRVSEYRLAAHNGEAK